MNASLLTMKTPQIGEAIEGHPAPIVYLDARGRGAGCSERDPR